MTMPSMPAEPIVPTMKATVPALAPAHISKIDEEILKIKAKLAKIKES